MPFNRWKPSADAPHRAAARWPILPLTLCTARQACIQCGLLEDTEVTVTDSLVVAFGGNAILPSGQRGTLDEQREHVCAMSAQLGRLVRDGHRVVVTHGNGPQVGDIMLRSELASPIVPPVTLDVAGAMSQGQIGYMLQQEIRNYLSAWGAASSVCTLVVQVVVDFADPAFQAPTKPIGRFYNAGEAETMRRERGWIMAEDAGRGYRRVVASPAPQSIVEWPAVKALIDSGVLVIAAGGGGVPVAYDNAGRLHGVEAVIDKDLSAWRLGSLVRARTLALLTEVEAVTLDYGTHEQRQLGVVSMEEMQAAYHSGQFPAGSMGPKVRAALGFLVEGGERVIITSPSNLVAAVEDRTVGTQIVRAVAASSSRKHAWALGT